MSSLFDTPTQEVDLVFPSYQHLMRSLVDLVRALTALRDAKCLIHLNSIEYHYGYLLTSQPSLQRFTENQEYVMRALKEIERDWQRMGVFSNLRVCLQAESTKRSHWTSRVLDMLGLMQVEQDELATVAKLLSNVERSYLAIRAVWNGRVMKQTKRTQRRQSTYFVLSTLSSVN